MTKELGVRIPSYFIARGYNDLVSLADTVSYPVLVRPSFVLGGRAMQIVYNRQQLMDYVFRTAEATSDHPILIDEFLENAIELDVDALCDGSDVYVAGIMEHIEEAGIHSGDSSCVLPSSGLSKIVEEEIHSLTKRLALALNVVGLINMQFAVKDETVYVLEVNPRSSRTVPFVSKVTNIPLAGIAAQLALGKKLKDLNLWKQKISHVAVKKAVFPFNKFPDEKVYLGPEMRSTGEVMGISITSGEAFLKAVRSDGYKIPMKGTVFISVNDNDKKQMLPIAHDLHSLGFSLVATSGTASFLNENGLNCTPIFKVGEGRPNIVDALVNDNVDLVINTPLGSKSRYDEQAIGKTSIMKNILTITTLAGAVAAISAMKERGKPRVKPLQDYFKESKN